MNKTTADQQKILTKNLSEFGLSEKEAAVYIELTRNNTISSYKLHQITRMGRSVLDKILKSLIKKNLVSLTETNQSKLYTAHPYKSLSKLVEVKEAEVGMMKDSLDKIYTNFDAIIQGSSKNDGSKILHYYGEEGLKQVVWNSLRAKDEMRIFEVARLSAFLQKNFAEKYRKECALRGIKHYDLTNESFMPGWTDIHDFIQDYQETRYIDPKILEIKFEIYTYNDVVTMLDYKDNELLCVEIYNASLATLQRQLFDYVWKDAKKMEVTGPRGEMKVIE